MGKRAATQGASTTVQVRKDVRDRLEVLKVLGNFEDLNAVISGLVEHYAEKEGLSVDEKMDAFLRKLRK